MYHENSEFAEVKNKCGGTCKVVVGGAWGDEGKGKIASKFAENADLVIRGNGGANAGHSVKHNGISIGLHLIPGGIIYPHTTCLLGQGMVIDPECLLNEIKNLENAGVKNVRERIRISYNVSLVFPYHKDLDELYESFKKNPIGTTKRGIGPTYADKAYRSGLRLIDLLRPRNEVKDLLETSLKPTNALFSMNGQENKMIVRDFDKLLTDYMWYAKELEPMMEKYPNEVVHAYYAEGKNIVIEGAQAYKLDHNDPDYPNNTSSGCVTSALLEGAHATHNMVTEVVVVLKAHFSRVGNGPFITELPGHIQNDQVISYPDDEAYYGDVIRELAHEYGVSTGRPRRTGWFDTVIAAGARINMDADYLCINHLDTLGLIGKKLGGIKICVGYNYQGGFVTKYPTDMVITKETPVPVYQVLEGGWEISSDLRSYDELPEKAKQFIDIVEDCTKVPVKYIGIGPHNEDLIVRG